MKKQELKRIGNFVFTLEDDFLVCKSISDNWSVRWRDDSEFYSVMMMLLREDELVEEYLHRLVASFFIHTTHAHDWIIIANGGVPMTDNKGKVIKVKGKEQMNYTPFLFGYMQLCADAVRRESAFVKQSEEDEDNILDREELLQSIDNEEERHSGNT